MSLVEASKSHTAYVQSCSYQLMLGHLKAVAQPLCVSKITFIKWRLEGDLVHWLLVEPVSQREQTCCLLPSEDLEASAIFISIT